jgi:hypothetical protein
MKARSMAIRRLCTMFAKPAAKKYCAPQSSDHAEALQRGRRPAVTAYGGGRRIHLVI